MHVTAEQVTTVVSALVTVLTFIVGHVFHYKKVADKIASIGQKVEQDAPQIADATTVATGLVQDLSK